MPPLILAASGCTREYSCFSGEAPSYPALRLPDNGRLYDGGEPKAPESPEDSRPYDSGCGGGGCRGGGVGRELRPNMFKLG